MKEEARKWTGPASGTGVWTRPFPTRSGTASTAPASASLTTAGELQQLVRVDEKIKWPWPQARNLGATGKLTPINLENAFGCYVHCATTSFNHYFATPPSRKYQLVVALSGHAQLSWRSLLLLKKHCFF